MTQHTTASVAFLTGITARDRSEDVELLTTKLCAPPSRPLLVPRARLIARLDDSLRRGDRLILVSAPAGSGKTTLLGTWQHRLSDAGAADRDGMPARAPIGAAWLTLDPADNEPARFWRYLIGALQTIDPGLGGDAQRLLVAPRRPLPRKLMSSLLNDLAACPKTVVLILDDYQTIAAATIHKGLTFLADHASPQLQLVLSSRSDPPL